MGEIIKLLAGYGWENIIIPFIQFSFFFFLFNFILKSGLLDF